MGAADEVEGAATESVAKPIPNNLLPTLVK